MCGMLTFLGWVDDAEAKSQFRLGEKSQMYFISLDDRLGPDQCREQCCDEWAKSVL